VIAEARSPSEIEQRLQEQNFAPAFERPPGDFDLAELVRSSRARWCVTMVTGRPAVTSSATQRFGQSRNLEPFGGGKRPWIGRHRPSMLKWDVEPDAFKAARTHAADRAVALVPTVSTDHRHPPRRGRQRRSVGWGDTFTSGRDG